ncbi:2597_t:CDS:2 [Scutellospora calospora]|uniref:2597_t:CDS:1 n=1 Tax=Scutellospora calospora TaxID=85575 RepID=A0ACA9JTS3_9GLOM|nr:2597_t:CDS:2 [Scutellospora calospora]
MKNIRDNSKSIEQPTTSSLSSAYSTINIDSEIYDNLNDLYFDKMAVEVAKAYANSISQLI